MTHELKNEGGHTPGPWYPGHHTDPASTCNCRSIVSERYAGAIAVVEEWNGIELIADGSNDAPPRNEAVANAHLIAAAPDMLAALKVVERDRANCNGRVLEMHAPMIRAAIAKAEGRAP